MSLAAEIEDFARSHGAELFGVTSAKPFHRYLAMVAELEGMANLRELPLGTRIIESRGDPRSSLPDAQSVIVVGIPYKLNVPGDDSPNYEGPHVFLSRDIRHRHGVIHNLDDSMVAFLNERGFEAKKADEKPGGFSLKSAAVRAGLGDFGKNVLVYTKEFGSWITWVGVTTNARLEVTEAEGRDICGKCTKCIEACPAGALYEPYKHFPPKCRSYLTLPQFQLEEIPDNLKEKIDNLLCCCETCQDVCPKNEKVGLREASTDFEISFHGIPVPDRDRLPLSELLQMLEGEVNPNFQRYAAICIGNIEGAEEALPALNKMLDSEDHLVRKYAQWAIDRIKNRG